MALTYGIRHFDGQLKNVTVSNRVGGSAIISEGNGLAPCYDVRVTLTDGHGWVLNTGTDQSGGSGGLTVFGIHMDTTGFHGLNVQGNNQRLYGVRVFNPSVLNPGLYDGVNVSGDLNHLVGYYCAQFDTVPAWDNMRTGLRFETTAADNTYLGYTEPPNTGLQFNDLGTGNVNLAGGVSSHDHTAGDGGTVSHDDLIDQTPEHDLYQSFSQTGTTATGIGTHRLYIRHTFDIIDVEATVGNAPSGGSVVVDVNTNGTSIYSTGHPTITTGTNTSGAAAPDGTSTGVSGDYVTVDVDSTTAPASDLTVIVRYRRT